MQLDYSWMRLWLDLLQLAALSVIGIYSWIVNRSKANKTMIDRVEVRVDAHDRRLDVMESRIGQAPTHEDLGKVYERLNGVAEKMENLTGQLGMVSHQLSVMHEYLLNNRDGGSR